jgi:hypothetical protein
MKVFISWSGDLSLKIANCINNWLGNVLQGVDVWFSPNIDKGSIWFSDIAAELEKTGVGILCLTRDNLDAPWILFEAGALSKGGQKNRVVPLLINLTPRELTGPLAQFNAMSLDRKPMFEFVRSINEKNDGVKLAPQRLIEAFDIWWERFENQYHRIIEEHRPTQIVKARSTDDVMSEVLENTRAIQKLLHDRIATPTLTLAGPTIPIEYTSEAIEAWKSNNWTTVSSGYVWHDPSKEKRLIIPEEWPGRKRESGSDSPPASQQRDGEAP